MRRLPLPLLIALPLVSIACRPTDPLLATVRAAVAQQGEITVESPFALPPFTDAPMPVYLTIRNGGSGPDTLLGATSDSGLPTPMLHGGDMAAAGPVVIPPRGELRLTPGRDHLMFDPPLPRFARGDSVHLTLHFARAGKLAVWAHVIDYAEVDALR